MTAKTYLCVVRSPAGTCDSDTRSPAEMEQAFAKFNAWKAKFADNIVDLGGKLGGGAVVTAANVKDGPFAESKEIIGGYMIIRAEDMAQAVEVAQQSPGASSALSSVEVREIETF
ncbi:MAG: YciI family protein [Pseudomonadota bacterium]